VELIAMNIRIKARPAAVRAALTTAQGIGAAAVFRFGAVEAIFLVDRLDSHAIEMTCVDHRNCPEWLDTHLAFRIVPAGEGAYVDMLHDGFRCRSACYAESIERWTRCLESLRAYLEESRQSRDASASIDAFSAFVSSSAISS
jgi:hypothetical protein